MEQQKKKFRFNIPHLSFNAPVTLSFAALCTLVMVLDIITGGISTRTVFSVYRAPLSDPLTYVRCLCHVFGHADWNHLLSNMMYLLLLGPMLEEKYGGLTLAAVMAAAAVVTGIVNMLFFPGTMLLGASGIVFAMILLCSFSSFDGYSIPVTFILIAVLYLGREICNGLFTSDNISQLGHIVGGIVGSAAGFLINRARSAHKWARKG